MTNPLSLWNFYFRNKRKVLPVIGILALAILGVVVTDSLLASARETAYATFGSYQKLILVAPRATRDQDLANPLQDSLTRLHDVQLQVDTRFPDQLAPGFVDAGAGGSAVGSSPARALSRSLGVPTAAGADGGAACGAPAWAMSLSSGLLVQRHANVATWSPLMPSVRTSVHTPHASTTVATIVARRGPPARRRLATAQATKARHRIGMA